MESTEIKENQFITKEIIEAVLWTNILFRGKVTFCGSFGLVINKKIQRPIHDIDCITREDYYGHFFKAIGQYGINTSNSAKFTINDVPVRVFKLTSPNGIEVDVMYRPDRCKSRVMHIFSGTLYVPIKVEDPDSAIEVKRNYLNIVDRLPNPESAEKHKMDLEYIEHTSKYESKKPLPPTDDIFF